MLPNQTHLPEKEQRKICQARTRKDGKPCTRPARKGEKYCWQHSPNFWRDFRRIGVVLGGIAAGIILYTNVIKNMADTINILFPSVTPTPSQTFTATSTATSTFTPVPTSTSTPTPTATPKAHGIYYMIVLDASLKMEEAFDGRTKWDAALGAINAILESREEEANYGLVVIGGSESQGGADPCEEPSTLAMPFSSRESVLDHINQLHPSSGGSIYKAFNLAKEQFEDQSLPENTVHTLIFITGSSDSCEGRDEWADLERAYNFPGGIGVELYSEIIVLEQNRLISRTIQEQFENLSANLNVQSPTNFMVLSQTNNSVIYNVLNNVTNYIDATIASIPTNTPTSTSIPTITATLKLGETRPVPPTDTPTSTSTNTPTFTPTLTLISPTDTSPPEVLYITNLESNQTLNCNPEQECRIDVLVQWVPDTKSHGRNLSVWVRPMPELPDNSGQDYHSQNPPQYQGNGIWKVTDCYVGKIGDYTGMNFAIYVIVTDEPFGTGIQRTFLPQNLDKSSVTVKRGNP